MLTLNGDDTYTNITLDWTKCDYITNVGEVGIQFDKYPSNLKYDVYSKDYTQLASGQSLSKFMMNSNSAVTPSAAADKIVHLYCKGLSPEDISCSIVAPSAPITTDTTTTTTTTTTTSAETETTAKTTSAAETTSTTNKQHDHHDNNYYHDDKHDHFHHNGDFDKHKHHDNSSYFFDDYLCGDHLHSHIHICCDIVLCKYEQYEYVCYNKYNYKYYSDDYHFCDGNFRQCGDNCGDRGEQLSSTDNSKL